MFELLTILFAISTISSQNVLSSCLNSNTLENLGFQPSNYLEKDSSSTTCTHLYSDSGRCIQANTIKPFIESKQNEFNTTTMGYVQVIRLFDNFSGKNSRILSRILDETTNTNPQQTLEEKIEEEIQNAQKTHEKCFKTHNQLTHEVSCLLSSGIAAQNVLQIGNTLKIKTASSALQLIPDCMSVISVICLYFKEGSEASLDNFQTDKQKQLCEEFNIYQACMDNQGTDSRCLTTDLKKKMFSNMYAPYENFWLPDVDNVKSITDKMQEWLNSSKDTVFDWLETLKDFISFRILQNDVTIEFVFTDNGYDFLNPKTYDEVPTDPKESENPDNTNKMVEKLYWTIALLLIGIFVD